MKDKMTPDQAREFLRALNQAFDAEVISAQAGAPNEINTLRISLTTARTRQNPFEISFPHTSIYVEDASDINTLVRIIPNSKDDIQQDVALKKNDSFRYDRGVSKSYLWWDAQPNKVIVIKFFVSSQFTSGSMIMDQASVPASVSLGHGTADLDGYTRQINMSFDFTGGMTASKDIEDLQANSGSLTINTNVTSDLYVVPAGYYAEVVGFSANIITALSTGALYLFAKTNGATYTDATMNVLDGLAYICNSTDAADVYDVRPLAVGSAGSLTKAYVRRGLIFVAGEIPVLSTGGTALDATSEIECFMLLRLKPVVGVTV